ncbi:hypothetical protein HZB78_03735 [Candidatus Collierbacteria bacterium]|nr:hypothetical protein [Candidatus Collierbacteria bacterium]
MNPFAETQPASPLQKVDWADRLAHLVFTGIWIKDPKILLSSMRLAGLSGRGTNLMVNAYFSPEIFDIQPDDLAK